VEIIDRVIDNSRAAIPPLQRLEHAMHPLVSFVIMPIFALANAGVSFDGINLQDVFSTNIAAGVMFGLLVGKPVGIVLSTVMLSKLGIASPSGGLTIRRLLGIGFLASIGFTMSMFISTLAFADGASLVQAKLGIFKKIPMAKQIEIADKFIEMLQIKTASRETLIKQLSGGNQQKAILARWLATNPDFLILDEPTRGIDIGTKTEIQKLVLKLADEGKSVMFISSEIEEMLRTCNRMAVLRDGAKVGEISGDDLTQEGVMKAIAGGGK